MARGDIRTKWDRQNRIIINDNFKELYEEYVGAGMSADEARSKATDALSTSKKALDHVGEVRDEVESFQKQLDDLILNDGEGNAEVIQARDGEPLLKDRLNRTDDKLSETVNKNDYKKFFMGRSEEVYLYDLQLANSTANQCLVIDEKEQEIYATQKISFDGDSVESFVISRLTIGGKLLDDMVVRRGGHGTSIALEQDGVNLYIWSNMIEIDQKGDISTQYLSRFLYYPGEEISISDDRVEKVIEFPDRFNSMYPFSDVKNGVISLCHSNSNTNPTSRKVETHNVDDLKRGFLNPQYTFKFTDEMNNKTLQGLSLDGNNFYVSFGVSARNFHLFHIDMEDGSILGEVYEPVGLDEYGKYEDDQGEPEGLFLYTDTMTGHKTLLTVVVTGKPGRKRQKLIAFSWNAGVQKFLGLSGQKSQNVKITKDDGKSKRVIGSTSISNIKEPGYYYFTTSETNDIRDHPKPGVGGWWLYVSANDTNINVHQTLIRNSIVTPETFTRVVSSDNNSSGWSKLAEYEETEVIYPSLINGWKNFYADNDLFSYYKNSAGQLVILGVISNESPSTSGVVYTFPSGFRPRNKQSFLVKGSGSTIVELVIEKNGDFKVGSFMGAEGTDYVFSNVLVPLR